MAVVNTVQADPSLRHWPLVRAPDPGGSCPDAAGGRVPIPGQPLGKSAVGRAACFLPGLVFRGTGRLRADASLILGLPLAVVVLRGGRLANAGGDAVVVSGAAVRARPMLPEVRVAAFLRSALVGLRVFEAHREVHHQAGGPGTAGPPVGVPLCPVFPEG